MDQQAARPRVAAHELAPWEWRPRVGETVDGYVLEAELGRGGFGVVFRARRGGRLYAVKFLQLRGAPGWAWRELDVMLRVRRMGGIALVGHGQWPVGCESFVYLVMEYVRGRSLYQWAQEVNPTSRQTGAVLLPLARYVAEMHAEQVVHRDIKGENILVRVDGGPVLVDFGLGTYPGAPQVTGWDVPGSRLYQSPEALRFPRTRQRDERSPCRTGDDVWALGVVLYKLLTDVFPFDAPHEEQLVRSIIVDTPPPPHVLNPRVPPALGELCMRLLEKQPEARLGEARALAEALEEMLEAADATWEPAAHAWRERRHESACCCCWSCGCGTRTPCPGGRGARSWWARTGGSGRPRWCSASPSVPGGVRATWSWRPSCRRRHWRTSTPSYIIP
jgi:eukaryotic-like serine/threonine-protein kinase